MARKRIQPTAAQIASLDGNPFVNQNFIVRVRKRKDPQTFRRDGDGVLVPKEYDQEIDPATKVYISSEVRQRVALLSSASAALLLWIQQELESGKDYVVINRQRYMQEHHHKTDKPIKEALFDLVRYQFIAPTLITNVYWINPRFLFNGSRLNKYPDNIEYEK